MGPRRVVPIALVVLASCAAGKGKVVGRLEYMDSRWDPGAEPSGVPPVLVHMAPGSEMERRAIVSSYLGLLEEKDPAAPDPSFVEFVISSLPTAGSVLDAAEVDATGRFSLGSVESGDHLVFAEYTTDLGHMAWIEHAAVLGTRTTTVELTYRNRLDLGKLEPVKSTGSTLPPAEVIADPEKLEEYLRSTGP